MSNTDRSGSPNPQRDESLDPDAPALDENAEAKFGEKGPAVPDEKAGLSEDEKLDDAVADLDNE